jgi:hypothetical protein
MIPNSIHVATNDRISSIFIAEKYSIVYIDHIFYVYSSLMDKKSIKMKDIIELKRTLISLYSLWEHRTCSHSRIF